MGGFMSRRKQTRRFTYTWKGAAHVRGSLDPQMVGERLEAMRSEHGEVKAQTVLDDARPVTAPLHAAFEWDDSLAAEQFRLSQARHIINTIVAVPTDTPDATPIRAFVVIGEVGEQAYTSTYVAMSDAELRQQILQRALRELRAWQAKYRELTELAKVFEAMEEVAA